MVNLQFVRQKTNKFTNCKATILLTYNFFKEKKNTNKQTKKCYNFPLLDDLKEKSHQTATILAFFDAILALFADTHPAAMKYNHYF